MKKQVVNCPDIHTKIPQNTDLLAKQAVHSTWYHCNIALTGVSPLFNFAEIRV
jgi:hypothetical protein